MSKNKTETQVAIETIEGFKMIAARDMMLRGVYVTEHVVDPKLAESGAVCHGHQACAIGSLWLAHGEPLRPLLDMAVEGEPVPVTLDGTEENMRRSYLMDRPTLRLALDALNDATEELHGRFDDDPLNDAGDLIYSRSYADPLEAFFEGDTYPDVDEMIDIANLAIETLRSRVAVEA